MAAASAGSRGSARRSGMSWLVKYDPLAGGDQRPLQAPPAARTTRSLALLAPGRHERRDRRLRRPSPSGRARPSSCASRLRSCRLLQRARLGAAGVHQRGPAPRPPGPRSTRSMRPIFCSSSAGATMKLPSDRDRPAPAPRPTFCPTTMKSTATACGPACRASAARPPPARSRPRRPAARRRAASRGRRRRGIFRLPGRSRRGSAGSDSPRTPDLDAAHVADRERLATERRHPRRQVGRQPPGLHPVRPRGPDRPRPAPSPAQRQLRPARSPERPPADRRPRPASRRRSPPGRVRLPASTSSTCRRPPAGTHQAGHPGDVPQRIAGAPARLQGPAHRAGVEDASRVVPRPGRRAPSRPGRPSRPVIEASRPGPRPPSTADPERDVRSRSASRSICSVHRY